MIEMKRQEEKVMRQINQPLSLTDSITGERRIIPWATLTVRAETVSFSDGSPKERSKVRWELTHVLFPLPIHTDHQSYAFLSGELEGQCIATSWSNGVAEFEGIGELKGFDLSAAFRDKG
jgi:hypothetical protein